MFYIYHNYKMNQELYIKEGIYYLSYQSNKITNR